MQEAVATLLVCCQGTQRTGFPGELLGSHREQVSEEQEKTRKLQTKQTRKQSENDMQMK